VYVSVGWQSDPNKFSYDAKFSSMKEAMVLNSASWPSLLGDSTGFTISIYVQGINSKENALLYN